jgi:ketosteroid isomerase-like protein
MANVETQNEELVRSFFEILSAGELERLRSYLYEQATWTVMDKGIPGAGEKKAAT